MIPVSVDDRNSRSGSNNVLDVRYPPWSPLPATEARMTNPMLKLPPRFTQRDLVDANSARQMTTFEQPATLELEDGTWFGAAQDGTRLPIRRRGSTQFGYVHGVDHGVAVWAAGEVRSVDMG